MDKDISNAGGLLVALLQPVRSDVLPLGQLKDVFHSICDLKCSIICEDGANVSGKQPSVRVDRLRGLCLVFVVARDHIESTNHDLSSGGGPTLLVLICRQVVHSGDIPKLELVLGGGAPHMADCVVGRVGQELGGEAFSLAITLNEPTAETHLQKLDHLWRDGGRPRQTELHPSPECLLNLIKHQSIIYVMSNISLGGIVVVLDIERSISHYLLHTGQLPKLSLNQVIEPVIHPRNGSKNGRPQNLEVFLDFADIPTKHTVLASSEDDSSQNHFFHDVGKREVRQVDHFNVRQHVMSATDHSGDISMREHGALWAPSGAGGVGEEGDVFRGDSHEFLGAGLASLDNLAEGEVGDAFALCADLVGEVSLIEDDQSFEGRELARLHTLDHGLDVVGGDEEGRHLGLLEHDLGGFYTEGVVDGDGGEAVEGTGNVGEDPFAGVAGLDAHELKLIVLELGFLFDEALVDEAGPDVSSDALHLGVGFPGELGGVGAVRLDGSVAEEAYRGELLEGTEE